MLLMTNVDNINFEQIPYLVEQLMQRGARNVHVINALTKKGRQEYILFIDVPDEEREAISKYLAAEIGTLGVRILQADHVSFRYEICPLEVQLKDELGQALWRGNVNVKMVMDARKTVLSARAEYEDLKKAAEEIDQAGAEFTFYELKQMIEAEALNRFRKGRHRIEIEPAT